VRVLLVPNTAASMVWFREPFLRELVARGHRVWVAAPDGWGAEQILATGASFLPVFQHQGWAFGATDALESSYTDPLKDLRYLHALRRICQVVRPDVVLAYTHKLSVLVPLAARAAGVSRVHGMITGFGPANLTSTWRQRAVREAFFASVRVASALSASTLVLNRDNYDDALRWRLVPPARLFLLDGEGVDTERYQQPPPAYERGATCFLMVARLVRYKGVHTYVEAARSLRQRWPNARFLLAGAVDPQHPDAVSEAELEAWRAEGAVELLGHVNDVRPLLAACHAFVLPSHPTEGLPMSIMEAMSASRPILTTRAPGNRETVEHGVNGALVEVDDAAGLAREMERLLDDPALGARMGAASRARCLERFDHRIVNRALLHHLGL
jgi:glycosyltransferase involved in cell wall biosynthesis